MPFSFVQIEKDKTQSIGWSFAFLVLFYFVAATLLVVVVKFLIINLYLGRLSDELMVPVWDWRTLGWTWVTAGVVSLLHWAWSTDSIVDRTVGLMSARKADTVREAEQVLRNVVDEVTVATGSKQAIETYVLPTSAMNAFALQDFEGRSVIGVTEGLLQRLNRAQLEAVVAHEAGHLACGDSLSTTVTSSIFRVFDNLCDMSRAAMEGYGQGRGRKDGRIFLILAVIFLLASLLRFVGFLGAMFISREREYRADALAVRLTRNPLALAEALHIIDSRWKGGGMPGGAMEAIFIQSPRRNYMEDEEDWVSKLFTTHPPVRRRIGILLDMAHADESVLENALKDEQRRVEKAAEADGRGGEGAWGGEARWMVNRAGQWLGPFDLSGMQKLEGLGPDTLVRRVNGPAMLEARLDRDLWAFLPALKQGARPCCPRCQVPLAEETYEGVAVQRCQKCLGVLVSEMDVLTITGRREMMFSARIVGLANLMLEQPPAFPLVPGGQAFDEKSIPCPVCRQSAVRMTRRFVNRKYPVEVDKCPACARVWFDKDELELLQCMYEKTNPLPASAGQSA
ncbi:MAG: M48 family metalloprotease [Candidatus Omnitrophica bacterium]|nr:M48 family metalloprotease [Candidatus Omnitrophota bacterium]